MSAGLGQASQILRAYLLRVVVDS